MSIVKKCKDILIKYDYIVFAYIFGSYATDKMRQDSDIDIAIYLNKYKIEIEEYLKIKNELSQVCNREVDLVILNNAVPLLKYEIYQKNILLFTKDKTIENRYNVRVLFEYEDMKRYLDLSYNVTIERMKKEVESNG